MKKLNINEITLFCTENESNGTNNLILVNDSNEIVAVLENALFGATTKLGANNGVYAETCGGYAGQIHGAAYIGYNNDVFYASNLDNYECDCEICEEHGYEESTCEMKDWSAIEYLDNCFDGDKLYWIEFYALERLAASSPVVFDGFQRIMNFLSEYVNKEEILKELEPNETQKRLMLCHALESGVA